jgi:hypothetical protein
MAASPMIEKRLLAAIRSGDVAALDAMLRADPGLAALSLDLTDPPGAQGSLLHRGVIEGQLGVAAQLAGATALIDARSSEGRTALHYAFGQGRNDITDMLIRAGAEVDICMAAAYGFHDRLREILAQDPTKVDDLTTGLTPMTWAGFGRQTGSMRLLAAAGASDAAVLAEVSRIDGGEQDRASRAMFDLMADRDALLKPRNTRRLQGAPLGDCILAIDPSPIAPRTANIAHLRGLPAGMEPGGLAHLVGVFGQAGVERFSVSLTPGPDMDEIRRRLVAAGFKPRGAKQAVLLRDARPPANLTGAFEVRELGPDEVRARAALKAMLYWPEAHESFIATAGVEGFSHFMAFSGDEAAAVGALAVKDAFGCLMLAATAHGFRGRGAQQALIGARIAKGIALGCERFVSETEQVLVPSYRNLRRAGFELAYEKEVFAWNPIVA